MKKRRLFWTLIMLALMLLSLLTMFLPWFRVLDGSGAELPGVVLRRIFMAVTGLAFAGSLFFFFARRTAWGLVYLLVQALNLLASCLVVRGANPEDGTAVYGVTGWFVVCIFLTAGAAAVWLAGLIAGVWKRSEAGGPERNAKKKARGIAAQGKTDEKNESLPRDAAYQTSAEELDDEYAEALAIAEAAELEKKKAAAQLAAARSEGAGGRPGEASASDGGASSDVRESAAFFMAEAESEGPVSDGGASSDVRESAAFFMAEAQSSGPAAGAGFADVEDEKGGPDTGASFADDEDKVGGPDTGAGFADGEDEKGGPAAGVSFADVEDEKGGPAAGVSFADDEDKVGGPDTGVSFADDEDKVGGPDTGAGFADVDDEADTSAYFLDDDDEEDEEPLDEEKAEDEDFMDALGGFLGSFFALVKKGVLRAAKGIRAGAAGIKERKSLRSGKDPAEAEGGAGADDAYDAEMSEKLRGLKKTSGSDTPEKLRGADVTAGTEELYGTEMAEDRRGRSGADVTAGTEELYGTETAEDRRGKRSADEIAAAIAGEDPENKDRFRIFGRVQRDETEEEPEFLRKRRRKAPKKGQKSDLKKGFVPSLGMVVKGLIALTAILVIGIAAFLLVKRFKLEKIDLRDYVVISSSGYEGYGKADVAMDRDALVKALADALARKGQIRPGSGTSVEAFRAFEHYNTIMTQLTVTVDKEDHLSNGDEVTAGFAFDNDVLKEFGLKLEPESISHTVRGLRAVRQYSPFDSDLIVAFSGTEPYGQIVLTWAGDYPLHFTESRSDGLSNGDVVEVTAVPDDGYDAEALATECGIILSETSREFIVAGLSNYLRETGSLDASVFGVLDAEARDIVAKEAAGHYGKNETMADCVYVGAAVLTGTEMTAVRNYLYMLYQLTYERGETTFSYYYYVRFEDVILHMDGGYERGEAYEVPGGRHGLFGLLDNDDALRIDWLHAVVGFAAVEDFYARKVAPLLETYTIDTDLGIDGIPAQALTASESGGTAASGTAGQAASGTAETASGAASAEAAPGTVSAEPASGTISAEPAPGTASAEPAIAPEGGAVTSV